MPLCQRAMFVLLPYSHFAAATPLRHIAMPLVTLFADDAFSVCFHAARRHFRRRFVDATLF